MITRIPACASLLAVLVLAAAPAAGQQPASGPARCAVSLVRFRFPGGAVPMECDGLAYLANSKDVFDAALNTAAQRNAPRAQHSYARLECTTSRRTDDACEIEAKLFVYLDEADAAVDENAVLDALIEKLRAKLRALRDDDQDRLNDLFHSALKRKEDLAQLRETLRKQQAELLQQAGAPHSPAEVEKSLITFQDKRRELELTLAGQRARQEAISKAMADLNARIQERAASDAVVSEMQQVVEIRERILERTRARAAASIGSTEEVDRAIESATLARADLARARVAAVMNAGGDQLARLNADLTQLSIDAAEVRARLDLLTKQTEELRSGPAMKNAVEYDQLAMRLRDVDSALEAANAHWIQVQQQRSRLEPPSLKIIGR